MAVQDHTKHYVDLRDPASVVPTPNTVSRNAAVGDRSFQTVVWQSGKAVLDAELQCSQDAVQWDTFLFRKWQVPSGWLRGVSHYPVLDDYTLGTAPLGVTDDSGVGAIHVDNTLINAILLPRLEAVVAGHPVVVEYTNTHSEGYNLVTLEAPQIYDGTAGTVKRTDFLFLEVWLALVAPSPTASGSVTVADAVSLQAGDFIAVAGVPLAAVVGAPGVDEFQIVPGDDAGTAANIAAALLDPLNSFATFVSAIQFSNIVSIRSVAAGSGTPVPPTGNHITLTVTTVVPGALVASGPTLTGGEDRPSKPTNQNALYRHGNVLSPEASWLQDEMVDQTIFTETSQRVQLQYRIRSTGTGEAVNYKTHPDGFSTLGGGPPGPTIFAQGAGAVPVADYPFVPADRNSVWQNSSAVSYGVEDGGLWVAGDGSSTSALDLGSVDGFVYAIPIAFVHRHNDSSSAAPGAQGFDSTSNANGAPLYTHAGFVGLLGAIPAGLSDRPDGHFADVIESTNVLDLRRHVLLPGGLDTQSELFYQIQSLLDGNNLTWSVDTSDKQDLGGDTGDVSTRYLICNEIGRSTLHGGNDVTSGTTQRGVFVRDFDHIARRFGAQSVVERVVFAFYPGDRSVGPVVAPGRVNPGKYVEKAPGSPAADEWFEGDVLHLNLAELDATTLGGLFQGTEDAGGSYIPGWTPSVSVFAPPNTVITDVLTSEHDDGHHAAAIDQKVRPGVVLGLGTTHVSFALDANSALGSNGLPVAPGNPEHALVADPTAPGVPGSTRRIFVELEITYPLGSGATDTPDLEVLPDAVVYDGSKNTGEAPGPGPLIENDAAQRPNDFEVLCPPLFRDGYREILLDYVTNDTISHNPAAKNLGSAVGSINLETLVSRNRRELYFPRRVYGSVTHPVAVTDLAAAVPMTVDVASTEYGSSSRKVVVTANLDGAGQTLCALEYFPQDPIPNYGALGGGYQVSVYYRSNAPQTAGVKEGDIKTSADGTIPTTLNVEPLCVSPTVWTSQVGVGSLDRGFPYGQPLEQLPINDGLVPALEEWFFCATANIAISDFNTSTGLLTVHPHVQVDSQNVLQFGGVAAAENPRVDAEFRAYYPFAADWVYRPTVLSQPLYGAVRHKVFFPLLARIVEEVHATNGNGLLFRKNEIVLMVLVRTAVLDDENNVRFTDASNTTCAALYRTRNMLLVVGDKFRPVAP